MRRILPWAVGAALAGVALLAGRFLVPHRDAYEELAALDAGLAGSGWSPDGPVTLAQFDPPWIPGPWRRNEVQRPVVVDQK